MKIEIRECSVHDGDDILKMIREIGPGENGFINNAYHMKPAEFRAFLARNADSARGIEPDPARVPQTLYWLIADGYPVGMGKLRHYLNVSLRKCGGHIGYCIRPSERGKGFGTIILQEMLKKALEMNIPSALITCDDVNTASRRVIEKNGGKLEKVTNDECYFWIQLDDVNGIRQIHPDDYSEMVELWGQTPGMGLSEADSEANIRKFILRNKGLSYCFKEENRIIATILCGHDGRRGYIYHMTVAQQYRGKGIGKLLTEKSLQQLKNEGIDKCHLFVFADNELGNRFWSSTGWTRRDDIFTYSKEV